MSLQGSILGPRKIENRSNIASLSIGWHLDPLKMVSGRAFGKNMKIRRPSSSARRVRVLNPKRGEVSSPLAPLRPGPPNFWPHPLSLTTRALCRFKAHCTGGCATTMQKLRPGRVYVNRPETGFGQIFLVQWGLKHFYRASGVPQACFRHAIAEILVK